MILSNFPTKTITPESIGAIPNPTGGTAGQVLTKTADGSAWEDAPSGLPEGGTEGQILKRGASGAEWDDAEWLPLSGGEVDGHVTFNDYISMYRNADISFIFADVEDSGKIVFDSVYGNIPDININPVNDSSGYALSINSRITNVKTPNEDSDAVTLGYLNTQLSTKLTTPTGTAGQLLGFTADNTVGAVDAPESGLTQEQADERYLQLTGGTMTGDLTLSANGGTTTISPQDKKDVLITGRYLFFGEDTSAVGRYDYKVLTEGDYKEQFAPTSVRVLLRSFSWSDNTQTVTVSGVVASNTAQLITPIPSDSSRSAYYAAGIMCTEQAANSLTFTCQTVPTIDLIVYVVIQPLS